MTQPGENVVGVGGDSKAGRDKSKLDGSKLNGSEINNGKVDGKIGKKGQKTSKF